MNSNIIIEVKKNGYFFPVKIFNHNESDQLKKEYYSSLEKINSKRLKFECKFKSHLIFNWVNNLIRNESILKIAREYLGNNILCWNSIIFDKPANSKKFVGWHEDKTFWKLKNNNIITFSIAITESTKKNGCLKILSKRRNVEYYEKDKRNNMLARGQDAIIHHEEEFKHVILNPGECSIFEQDVIHGSDPNCSDNSRVLVAIRYITPDNTTSANNVTATLVSGEDNYNFYEKEPVPNYDFDEKCLQFHLKLMSKQAKVFAKHKLKKYGLAFASGMVSSNLVRALYYQLFK